MALQTSGTITLNDMHTEAGGSSATYCTLNDSDIRGLIGKSSGAYAAFNEWYGAAASVTITFNPTHRSYASGGASNYIRSGVHYYNTNTTSGALYGSFTGTTSSSGLFLGNSILQIYSNHHNLTGNGSFSIMFANTNGVIPNTDAAAFRYLVVNGSTITRSAMSYGYTQYGTSWGQNFVQGGGGTTNIMPIYQNSYPNSTVTFYK